MQEAVEGGSRIRGGLAVPVERPVIGDAKPLLVKDPDLAVGRVAERGVHDDRWRICGGDRQLQAQAIALGGTVTYLADEEAQKAAASVGTTVQRPWELWKRKALGR